MAASAITFSRRWQAPPPLTQLSWLSTLQKRRWNQRGETDRKYNLLVCTIKCYVDGWKLVDIAQIQISLHDQLFRLKSYKSRSNLDNEGGWGKAVYQREWKYDRCWLQDPVEQFSPQCKERLSLITGSVFNKRMQCCYYTRADSNDLKQVIKSCRTWSWQRYCSPYVLVSRGGLQHCKQQAFSTVREWGSSALLKDFMPHTNKYEDPPLLRTLFHATRSIGRFNNWMYLRNGWWGPKWNSNEVSEL